MRFKRRTPKAKPGNYVTKFLWWPKTLPSKSIIDELAKWETRWLETATWYRIGKANTIRHPIRWEDAHWVDV